ncbi:MAG: 30S ribosomal protein S4 [Candidatus Portnoybacteria bacterium RIFCSPLOWO2_12_FULL_39_9]|uniref:Small ribosomal subunit protein uS4 n=1 Tax=Candidatus Portnoybacteria bacterium RIFCSPHIGHO2_12_FULL_38_9 TaxID=1801997 RepID=A0A1G2FEM2_9BACT|nr:MAG: 30S ribosomal protein S4 [Candidatus Portnoybacteria bacterium RBG_13_40_8]OGZ36157.1 MAG: 30S ribosomal protein S4 [Candidatus Portnoybacteria bacterium RIFCSPHIGHO2_02_FULL_39_12]OGZ36515.1 MAG: 30S ribosomal protein S4 [Candidatus Portnoybacteria bacterium RIFCSPHIGHO2_12_FULL_38_9]OGZ38524.1 MAG: 30S ribosomal protein S4 [Candidatus Portnoybacteria bacterium RIFCSPLOWO2_01_FULL_38_39]OGZ41297.1 MAG: 30S ribosomal protein S4 [Candidatus Portnoybacteria bacterium RIFCSPLOWO2_12_FULL_3
MNNNCKKCRRAGEKLFLKGERCFSQKCAMIKRPYRPGLHGKTRRRRVSEYGLQLAEKQRIRAMYGISEKQFKNYVKTAIRQKGDKGDFLLGKLEGRLDNIVFRLGWAKSRKSARQLVNHGHILINQRKVDIPSCQIKTGDQIKIKEGSKKLGPFQELKTTLKKYKTLSWLNLDKENLIGQVVAQPKMEEVGKIGKIEMIIEFYSR